LRAVAEWIARLKDFEFAGLHDAASIYPGSLFFVPNDALVRADADLLGIVCADELFGAVVPHEFVKTKIITHELVGPRAVRPPGWRDAFARRVRDGVLPGYSVFAANDAREAAGRLLAVGRMRAKLPRSAGARGQRTLTAMRDVDALLESVSDEDLAEHGLLLEVDLDPVTTLSVGQVTLDGARISYHGHQRMTRDNAGGAVYGGSDLTCVRGGWEALDHLALDGQMRTAIRQARVYDDATVEYGLIASRRNYDVGQGVDAAGRTHSGVFEASWRAGGASPAEIAALEAFAGDPSIQLVRVSTVETYGADIVPPPGAIVHFHAVDKLAGPIARYTVVHDAVRVAA
jgi:hypothetical protein